MDQLLKEIKLSYIGESIDTIYIAKKKPIPSFSFHFTQNEEFFLALSSEYRVPSFKIHHDVRNARPDDAYVRNLAEVLEQLAESCPIILNDLSCCFDPSEIFKPCFYHMETFGGNTYLYLVRLDLSFKPAVHTVVTGSDNDSSPSYKTNLLFLESDFFPIENIEFVNGKLASFSIKQIVSNTWIGERGRGYSIQGIWMDRDLTKFLSMLFIPKGRRLYPYFPFTCKYKTLCFSPVHLSPGGRSIFLPLLHNAFQFLIPHMAEIEQDLRNSEFSENLPSFQILRDRIPQDWLSVWDSYRLSAYINDNNRKEWKLDFQYT